MRRKDREITNQQEITGILSRCDTIRIGMTGKEYPYVVPVSFGLSVGDGLPVVYFHCARQGLKVDLLLDNACVCIEGDIFHGLERSQHGITTQYESVIGFGSCTFVSSTEELIYGMQCILDHYGCSDYSLERCSDLNHMRVGKIVLERITGKRNFTESK